MPLIPTNAGTQIKDRRVSPEGLETRWLVIVHRSRHSIWVPAFAGMSGICSHIPYATRREFPRFRLRYRAAAQSGKNFE
jgi:hypothetical protein